ncbi:MAG: N-6 DNA methylase [Planctomycetota bacterium]|nr:N-6 DNA methylase [Planctomycetota bacterium]
MELKAPGIGANPNHFTGHNREQWKRFQSIPNLIYCDGNDWGLYRDGKATRAVVRLLGDVATNGKNAAKEGDAGALLALLRDFLSWHPIIPTRPGPAEGQREIDLKGLADLLAPLCRMLRDDVTDALKDPQSPLVLLAADWRKLLFPDASNEQFADAYAQTVTFALLLARSEGADPLTLASAGTALAAEHSLLSRALEVLTDPHAQAEISASLNLVMRVIGEVPQVALSWSKDPWLYFYEEFLAVYDPMLRKDAGAYYTPVEVVHAQVRLIDDLLTNRLGKELGFANHDVVTLDPALGTGTYLLGVIDHALGKVQARQGLGAVPEQATALAGNIYGFEKMVGPFAVSELRVSRALRDRGATMPAEGTHVYLTDTLESPYATPQQLPLWLKPISEQHAKALQVKAAVPVIVCLGNPPYDRHEAADESNKAGTGGWVRWGEDGKGTGAIFKDFVDRAVNAGHSLLVRNIYNLYVYFWRWALWKVLEQKTASGPGIVSFISASSYLEGDAFCGMREHMRHLCDEIWILDLSGEGRGTRKNENVFAIQTPVAIAVAVRYGKPAEKTLAKVHYGRIEGTRDEKLKALDAISDFGSLQWEDCPDDWQAPFHPAGNGAYFDLPLLTDLLPWCLPGVTPGRTWVIAPNRDSLERRWRTLCNAGKEERPTLFKESNSGCTMQDTPNQLPPRGAKLKPLSDLSRQAPPPDIAPYAFRSFDRQYLFADARLIDRPRPTIWGAQSGRQILLTTLVKHPLGRGPALTCSAECPDKHHFRGSFGGKDVIPLFRDSQGEEPNLLPGLLDLLGKAYGHNVTPEDFLAYVYGVLALPAFTDRYAEELGTRQLRVPLTKNPGLFAQARDVGAKLLWLHTYGQRFVPHGKQKGQVPKGVARCVKAVPGDAAGYPERYEYSQATKTLHVGSGEFSPVPQKVYDFEVSGLKVVQSWLGYRMKNPKGKKSSPLDDIHPEKWTGDFTTELLELLWVLEATLAEYPAQAKLLSAVVKGPCFKADELPPVPAAARKPPKREEAGLLDTAVEEDE